MKRVFTFLTAFLLLSVVTIAQKPAEKSAKPVATQTQNPGAKKDVKKEGQKAQLTKKDGTPDMRFKANKDKAATPVKGPLKKDGTPDKRFKANKTK